MKYLDEYRDRDSAEKLVQTIRRKATKPWVLMEVCGGQTHGLLRYGIESELKDTVELIHGPGCPVCVTAIESIDLAIELARRENMIVASFGDMLRVPGSQHSLLDVRGQGGQVQVVYSPLDAVELARKNPDQEVVFFAVGFETTAPATALAALQAEREHLGNFSLLVTHVRVLPAMTALVSSPDNRVQAFLAAGHVCTISGFESYKPLVEQNGIPVVVTGFEPVDLLDGILAAVEQLENNEARVENRYARSVRKEGNPDAQKLIDEVYLVGDRNWRGFGPIEQGGLFLRDRFSEFDAERKYSAQVNSHIESDCSALPVSESNRCHSAEVLAGKIKPPECPAFGKSCSPMSPLGAPMVSSEGACAAYFQYQPHQGK